MQCFMSPQQERNQLGTLGGARSLLKEAHIFLTMSDTFFQDGEKFFQGAEPSLVTRLALNDPFLHYILSIYATLTLARSN